MGETLIGGLVRSIAEICREESGRAKWKPETLVAHEATIPNDALGSPGRYTRVLGGDRYTLYTRSWNLTDEGDLVSMNDQW